MTHGLSRRGRDLGEAADGLLDVVRAGTSSWCRRRVVAAAVVLMTVTMASEFSGSIVDAAGTPATVLSVNAPFVGSPPATAPAVVGLATVSGGYDVIRADGSVSTFGAAPGTHPAPHLSPGATATGMAVDPATSGYWTVASNGVVTAVNAPYFGHPNIPSGGWGQYPAAVAIAAAPGGEGYYVLRANGVIDAFGPALHGSSAARLAYGTTAPVVAVAFAVDSVTGGWWIATSNGAVVALNAPHLGSPLARSGYTLHGALVTAIAALPHGSGYDVLRANGEVDSFGVGPRVQPPTTPLSVGAVADAIAIDPTTGGYYVGVNETAHDGYVNPLREVTALVPQEIDQGVDYCGVGPVYALGRGVVANLYEPGWPSGVFISYQLLAGPARGRYVYLAENVTPTVRIGQRVSATTVLGVMHDAKTCIETGWAAPPATPEHAMALPYFNGTNSTAYGLNFADLLASLGARPGLPQPHGATGPLLSDWPTW